MFHVEQAASYVPVDGDTPSSSQPATVLCPLHALPVASYKQAIADPRRSNTHRCRPSEGPTGRSTGRAGPLPRSHARPICGRTVCGCEYCASGSDECCCFTWNRPQAPRHTCPRHADTSAEREPPSSAPNPKGTYPSAGEQDGRRAEAVGGAPCAQCSRHAVRQIERRTPDAVRVVRPRGLYAERSLAAQRRPAIHIRWDASTRVDRRHRGEGEPPWSIAPV